jgi:predicted TIM-barrel fold metal-dependent hydrolase
LNTSDKNNSLTVGVAMMRIDVHTHIFPPEIVSSREQFFSKESAFRLLYESPKAKLVTAESLLEAMDQAQMDRSVIFGFPWENVELAARHNDYVLDAGVRYADRLIPLACVNPLSRGSLNEVQRSLEGGAKGLGELAVYESKDRDAALRSFQDLISCCRDYQGILLVHANEPVGHEYPGKAPLGPDFFYALAKLASGMDLILAHWGGGLCFYELLKKEAPDVLKRVYYDTAASPFLYSPSMYRIAIDIVGKEKILFGSDYPLLGPSRYFREMEEAGLTAEEINAISGENAGRLFGILDG